MLATSSAPGSVFHSVEAALEDLKNGRMIIVVDDENRENEGDLICAAQFATPQAINFMATEARGLICLAMQGNRLDDLRIPLMVGQNTDSNQTAFTVSIDAGPHLGVSTGISAADRSKTIQVALNPKTQPEDLRRPGHIFPLRAQEGGVLKRAGHTEAAVDLAILAGLYPAGVICEIQNLDGSMSRLPELIDYGRQHGLKIITIASLIEYRLLHECFVQRQALAQFPCEYGTFQIYAYRDTLDHTTHLALVKGDPAQFPYRDVLVRVHMESLLGDALGSLRTESRRQLETALKMIEYQSQGVVVYLREEGRATGLLDQVKSYGLQDLGLERAEAGHLPPDLRNYGVGAQILRDLGVRRMRLLTNNPRKISGLKGFGLELVERVPLLLEETESNIRYLSAKGSRSSPAPLQTHLLVVALYPRCNAPLQRALWLENLRRMAAAEELLAQEESRPLAAAVFGSEAVIAQIGLDHPAPEGIAWRHPLPASQQPYRRSLLRLLARLSQSGDLAAIAWMVSDGNNPLDSLRQTLSQVECVPPLPEDPDWLPQTIYHLKLAT